MRIILASASPRRKELLAQIGLDFEVIVSNVEEKVSTNIPYKVVEELSAQKAEGVLQEVRGTDPLIIIGSDTIVACDGQILGKPKSAEDAKNMLRLLQGRTHQVYTGVTVLYVSGGKMQQKTFHEATDVTFYPMSEQEIATYVSANNSDGNTSPSGWNPEHIKFDCEDKAGAYGIQGFCARYIKGITGDYNNVVGLPVGRLYQEIRTWI